LWVDYVAVHFIYAGTEFTIEFDLDGTNPFDLFAQMLANAIIVEGMRPEFQIGLAYNGPYWVKFLANYDNSTVIFTVPDINDTYRIGIQAVGYPAPLVIDNVRPGDVVDVSVYFYDVEIPAGVSDVFIFAHFPGTWVLTDQNDTFTLLKTNGAALARFTYNGQIYDNEFVLDGVECPFGTAYNQARVIVELEVFSAPLAPAIDNAFRNQVLEEEEEIEVEEEIEEEMEEQEEMEDYESDIVSNFDN
jgi:hypothetical protein